MLKKKHLKKHKINLTLDELDVLYNYITRKTWRLEDDHLEDSYCYPRLLSVKIKILKSFSKADKNSLQISKNML